MWYAPTVRNGLLLLRKKLSNFQRILLGRDYGDKPEFLSRLDAVSKQWSTPAIQEQVKVNPAALIESGKGK